jgi:aryl-alcohol dehydrogenase-like predicted oxidoreductase
MNEEGFAVLGAVEAIANERGTTIPAVALAWLLAKRTVTAPILGANSAAQLADLLPAAELALNPDEVQTLDGVSAGY